MHALVATVRAIDHFAYTPFVAACRLEVRSCSARRRDPRPLRHRGVSRVSIMARKKSLDELKQDSANHSRRAAETRRAIAWANVQIILKANMWASEDVERYLNDLGLVVVDGKCPSKGGEVEPSRVTVGVQKRDENKKRKQQEQTVAIMDEHEVASIEDVVPTKYYKLGQLSYSLLVTKVMPRLEPIAYSAQNLKSRLAGSVADKQATLLRRVEYDTGLGPDFSLSGKLRIWEVLLDFMVSCRDARNRRGRDLDWDGDYDGDDGVFKLAICDGSADDADIVVEHSLTGTQHKVARKLLAAGGSDPSVFYVYKNFSEEGAEIRSRLKPQVQGLNLRSLFAPDEFPSGNDSLYLPAIEDKPRLLALAGADGDASTPVATPTKKPRRGASADDFSGSPATASSSGSPGSLQEKDPEAASPTAAAAEAPGGGAGVSEGAIDDKDVVPPPPARTVAGSLQHRGT